ncbi:MAG TPA: hypothetical protein VLT84_11980, partial [Acidobacteriota bacterium]|nr:hypothetical protein [Acidobacteriota bacterium]
MINLAESKARAAGTSVDEAFDSLTQAEIEQAALEGMPAAARAAFLNGPHGNSTGPRSSDIAARAERARLDAIARNPQFVKHNRPAASAPS